jgi:glycosyltransferase involved in cell wall biosynthesis
MDSVIAQDFQELEILCVDDGSTDCSAEILAKYAKQDSRIKIISQVHVNAGAARNTGLAIARGVYVVFLDADDFFESTLALTTFQHASRSNADIAIFEYKLYDERRQSFGKRSWGIHTRQSNDVFSIRQLKKSKYTFTNIAVWNKAYRRQFLQLNGIQFQTINSFNDVHFSWLALTKAERIVFIPQVLTYYRINTGRSLTDLGYQQARDFVLAFTEIEFTLMMCAHWPKLKNDFKLAQMSQCYLFIKRLERAVKRQKTSLFIIRTTILEFKERLREHFNVLPLMEMEFSQ